MSNFELLGFALFHDEATIRPYYGEWSFAASHMMVVTVDCQEYLVWQNENSPADFMFCDTGLKEKLVEIHDSFIEFLNAQDIVEDAQYVGTEKPNREESECGPGSCGGESCRTGEGSCRES